MSWMRGFCLREGSVMDFLRCYEIMKRLRGKRPSLLRDFETDA